MYDIYQTASNGCLKNPACKFELIKHRLPGTAFLVSLLIIFQSCQNKTPGGETADLDYQIILEKMTQGEDPQYMWTHARSAAIPLDTPIVVTTMSSTLKTGSDVYHDLFSVTTRDLGQTWTEPEVIPTLRVTKTDTGYRSLADMWPQWHAASESVLNIGTSPFYTDNKTHDGSNKQVTYTVLDPGTMGWSASRILEMPTRDHEDKLLIAPAAGSAQWLELPGGDILLPLFYYKMSDAQVASASKETFGVSNMMKSDGLGFATIVARCSFDGETLTYKEHGSEMTLAQGRGVYEPSVASFQGEYFLTMRSDKSAYVAKSKDGLNFSPMQEWTFDDGSVLGSYNTQQHWVTHRDALFLVYTRRGANNDNVFRHRAPLFMAQVDPEKLHVIRATERIIVPNRGAALGNFGVTDVNESETWIVVAEYMRGEKNVEADNSVFAARLQWSRPNLFAGRASRRAAGKPENH